MPLDVVSPQAALREVSLDPIRSSLPPQQLRALKDDVVEAVRAAHASAPRRPAPPRAAPRRPPASRPGTSAQVRGILTVRNAALRGACRALDPRRTGRLSKGDLKRALRAALEGKRDVHGRATPEVRQAPPRQ